MRKPITVMLFGCCLIHILFLVVLRDIVNDILSNIYAESEDCIVDVYENGIYLHSRDFVKCDFLSLVSYQPDITLQTIPVGTYIDPIGTITT